MKVPGNLIPLTLSCLVLMLSISGSEAKPTEADITCKEAEALRQRGLCRQAITTIDRLLKSQPDNEQAHRVRMQVYTDIYQPSALASAINGTIKRENPEWDWLPADDARQRARADLEFLLAKHPRDASLWQRLIYFTEPKSDEACIDICTKAIDSGATPDWFLSLRGDKLQHSAQWEAALRDRNELVRRRPNASRAFRKRGDTLRKQGSYKEAIEDYTHAVQLEKGKDAGLLTLRGFCEEMLGEHDKAIEDCDSALRLHPNLASAIIVKTRACKNSGKSVGDQKTFKSKYDWELDLSLPAGW